MANNPQKDSKGGQPPPEDAEDAWWASGCERKRPALPPSAGRHMMDHLIATKTGRQQSRRPSSTSSQAHLESPSPDLLLLAEIIEAFEHGWVVVPSGKAQASSMLIRKTERGR